MKPKVATIARRHSAHVVSVNLEHQVPDSFMGMDGVQRHSSFPIHVKVTVTYLMEAREAAEFMQELRPYG